MRTAKVGLNLSKSLLTQQTTGMLVPHTSQKVHANKYRIIVPNKE